MTSAYWKEVNPHKQYTDEEYLLEGMRTIAVRRVGQALKNGTLRRADQCVICEREGPTVGHHWNGYDHPFDVWWICRMCNANLPHDRKMSLSAARDFIAMKYRKRWMRFFEQGNYKNTCDVCGLSDYVWNLSEWDKLTVCQFCDPEGGKTG